MVGPQESYFQFSSVSPAHFQADGSCIRLEEKDPTALGVVVKCHASILPLFRLHGGCLVSVDTGLRSDYLRRCP